MPNQARNFGLFQLPKANQYPLCVHRWTTSLAEGDHISACVYAAVPQAAHPEGESLTHRHIHTPSHPQGPSCSCTHHMRVRWECGLCAPCFKDTSATFYFVRDYASCPLRQAFYCVKKSLLFKVLHSYTIPICLGHHKCIRLSTVYMHHSHV